MIKQYSTLEELENELIAHYREICRDRGKHRAAQDEALRKNNYDLSSKAFGQALDDAMPTEYVWANFYTFLQRIGLDVN